MDTHAYKYFCLLPTDSSWPQPRCSSGVWQQWTTVCNSVCVCVLACTPLGVSMLTCIHACIRVLMCVCVCVLICVCNWGVGGLVVVLVGGVWSFFKHSCVVMVA